MKLLILVIISTIIGGIICWVQDGIEEYIKGGIITLFLVLLVAGIILLFEDAFAKSYEEIQYQYDIFGLKYK